MNMIKMSVIFASWSTEALWVFKIIAADAVGLLLSRFVKEARQMSEDSLTCQLKEQLTSMQSCQETKSCC